MLTCDIALSISFFKTTNPKKQSIAKEEVGSFVFDP